MFRRPVGSLALLLLGLPLMACGSSGSPASQGTGQESQWAGKTYYLNVSDRQWAYPRGIQRDLFSVEPAFFLKVGSGAHPMVTIAHGPGTRPIPNDPDNKYELIPVDDAQQDPCGPTVQVPLDGANSKSGLAPDLLRLFIANETADPPVQATSDVFGFKLDDVLPNGGAPSTVGTLSAEMDFRQMYLLFTLLGKARTAQSVCDTLRDHYTSSECMDPSCVVECQPCPNDQEPFCLTVQADSLGAVAAPNIEIIDVDENSRPASCDNSPPPSAG